MIWFFKRGNPFGMRINWLKKLILFPAYIAQLPFVVVLFFYCRVIDIHDDRRQFTGATT